MGGEELVKDLQPPYHTNRKAWRRLCYGVWAFCQLQSRGFVLGEGQIESNHLSQHIATSCNSICDLWWLTCFIKNNTFRMRNKNFWGWRNTFDRERTCVDLLNVFVALSFDLIENLISDSIFGIQENTLVFSIWVVNRKIICFMTSSPTLCHRSFLIQILFGVFSHEMQ